MTDLEIDKRLALAIGYPPNYVWATASWGVLVYRSDGCKVRVNRLWQYGWRVFSHKDWNVIGPIAEKFDAFPYKTVSRGWASNFNYAAAPQKAIALAVIGAKK